jgi:hypothetical protein
MGLGEGTECYFAPQILLPEVLLDFGPSTEKEEAAILLLLLAFSWRRSSTSFARFAADRRVQTVTVECLALINSEMHREGSPGPPY